MKSNDNHKQTPSNNVSCRTSEQLQEILNREPQNIEAAIELAEHLNSQGRMAEMLATLKPFEQRYPFLDTVHNARFDRLLAFGLVRTGRLLEAEEVLVRALKASPYSLDLHYALTFLRISMREYDAALEAGKKYLDLYETASGPSDTDFLTLTSQHRSQLLNFQAIACKETSRPDEAMAIFKESIADDPANHLPYLNLANLYIQRGQKTEAGETVAAGLEKCPQVQELRMLKDTCNQKATVSACLIVKNEEDLLDGCLTSIRDWVDEIILVDTGSTDRTVEIAENYGAKIFHQEWEGNFSKHRNYSIEQASSDWIFIIDADERIFEEDVPAIMGLLNQEEYPLLSINVLNYYGDSEDHQTFLPSDRFFRRDLDLRYKGIVHNQLDIPENVKSSRTGVRLKHLGYGLDPEKMKKKLARSKKLLEKQLIENPDNAFAHFNLAQLLRSGEHGFPVENAPELIMHAARGVELTDPENPKERHIHLMCLDQLGWTYFFTGRYAEALEAAGRALALKPDYLDPLFLIGHANFKLKEFDAAIEGYKRYIEIQAGFELAREMTNIIFFHIDSRAEAYYALAMISLSQNDTGAARDYYQKTLGLRPGHMEANAHLGRILFSEGRLEEAEKYFLRQFELGSESVDAAQGLAAIYTQRQAWPEAEKYYLKSLELQPDDIDTMIRLAQAYRRQGNLEQATRQFEIAFELTGGEKTDLYQQLANIYYERGLYEKAAGIYQQMVDRGLGTSSVYNELGNCSFRRDNLEGAIKYYQEALRQTPPLDTVYRNLGVTQAKLGHPMEAIWALEKFLEVNPGESELLQVVASLYASVQDFNSALSFYERFLQSHPNDPTALFHLSECYLNMGQKDAAILGYRRVLQIEPENSSAQQRVRQLVEPVGQA